MLQGSAQCTAEPTKTRIGSQVPFGEHARRLSTIAGSLKEAERGTHLVTSGFLQQVAALEVPLTRLSPVGFTVQLFSHSAFEIFGARFSFAVFAGGYLDGHPACRVLANTLSAPSQSACEASGWAMR